MRGDAFVERAQQFQGVKVGHFSTVGFCLDLGHAHLAEGVPASSSAPAKTGVDLAFEAFTSMPDRLFELHVHDNHGGDSGSGKDEHLWPGDGTLDFKTVDTHIAALKMKPIGMLEINYDLTPKDADIIRRGTRAAEIMSAL